MQAAVSAKLSSFQECVCEAQAEFRLKSKTRAERSGRFFLYLRSFGCSFGRGENSGRGDAIFRLPGPEKRHLSYLNININNGENKNLSFPCFLEIPSPLRMFFEIGPISKYFYQSVAYFPTIKDLNIIYNCNPTRRVTINVNIKKE